MNAISAFRKQIESRRAEQRQVRLVDNALERGLAAAEQDHELQLVGVDAFQRLCQAGYLEKPKPFGERKVLLQEPVPLKRTQRYRKKRLAVTEADRSNGAAGKEL